MSFFHKTPFEQLTSFLNKHKLPLFTEKAVRFHDGFALCPDSDMNRHSAHPVMVLPYPQLNLYKQDYKGLVTAVKYFARLHHVRISSRDVGSFNYYFSLLFYFISVYKRLFSSLDLPVFVSASGKSAGNFDKVAPYLTVKEVKRMHRDLTQHLMKTRGLSAHTAANILYGSHGKSLEQMHEVLTSYLSQYYSETSSDQKQVAMYRKMIRSLDTLKSTDPLSSLVGFTWEHLVLKKYSSFVKTRLQHHFNSSESVFFVHRRFRY